MVEVSLPKRKGSFKERHAESRGESRGSDLWAWSHLRPSKELSACHHVTSCSPSLLYGIIFSSKLFPSSLQTKLFIPRMWARKAQPPPACHRLSLPSPSGLLVFHLFPQVGHLEHGCHRSLHLLPTINKFLQQQTLYYKSTGNSTWPHRHCTGGYLIIIKELNP